MLSNKHAKLSAIKDKERVSSPAKMSDYKARIASPLFTQNYRSNRIKNTKTKMNGESANLTSKYIIHCTEEQAIVSGTARIKVFEAKMSRFMGFMSPRILMRKIVDFSNDNEGSELVESEKDFDIVNKKEKYLKRRSLKFQSKDRVVLSL